MSIYLRKNTNKDRPRRRFLVAVVLLLCIVFLAFFTLNTGLYPAMVALTNAKVERIAIDALNDAIMLSINSAVTYAELVKCSGTDDSIYVLQADSLEMNRLASTCISKAQDRLADMGEQGVGIALGTLTGIPVFSGVGPIVRISFRPLGSVRTEFSSSFSSAGINQTLYRVNIILHAQIYIILPGKSHSITVSAVASIAENVIVGDVPQVYTNVADEEDLLNLIPTDVP